MITAESITRFEMSEDMVDVEYCSSSPEVSKIIYYSEDGKIKGASTPSNYFNRKEGTCDSKGALMIFPFIKSVRKVNSLVLPFSVNLFRMCTEEWQCLEVERQLNCFKESSGLNELTKYGIRLKTRPHVRTYSGMWGFQSFMLESSSHYWVGGGDTIKNIINQHSWDKMDKERN